MSTEKIDMSNYVTKKQAALEAYRRSKQAQNASLLAICGAIVSTVATMYHLYAGSAACIIIAMGAAFFLARSRKDMIYLNETYELGFHTKVNVNQGF